MNRGIRNELAIRVVGYDLTACTNLKFYIRQNTITYSYTGTADNVDTEVMHVIVPKTDAVKFFYAKAELQVALTDSGSVPRVSSPINVVIGDMLEEAGYGI